MSINHIWVVEVRISLKTADGKTIYQWDPTPIMGISRGDARELKVEAEKKYTRSKFRIRKYTTTGESK